MSELETRGGQWEARRGHKVTLTASLTSQQMSLTPLVAMVTTSLVLTFVQVVHRGRCVDEIVLCTSLLEQNY